MRTPVSVYRYGHPAYWDTGANCYRYTSDHSLVGIGGNKACPKCGEFPKDHGGHDPCIANLPGVFRACCGHGVRKGHIKFVNGVVVKGWFDIGKKRPYTPEEIRHESERGERGQ